MQIVIIIADAIERNVMRSSQLPKELLKNSGSIESKVVIQA